ncbi:copper transpport protein [Malassezia equina]|uniref:Copper transport protein n=1 Tax=Malassezia equina TaxID=1381935 RepID=A0AAF0IZ80_9BASI|nr:copper transpport protein [Malassezia equina]
MPAPMSEHQNHMEHGGAGAACTMSMIWNTDTRGMCIVFRSWHVKTENQFFLSLLVVFALAMVYEMLKLHLHHMELAIAHTDVAHGRRSRRDDDTGRGRATPRRVMPLANDDVLEGDCNKRPALLSRIPRVFQTPARLRLVRSGLYGAQVALSCFLMLIMMTYNGWLLGAIVLGAIVGAYYAQQPGSEVHSALCH